MKQVEIPKEYAQEISKKFIDENGLLGKKVIIVAPKSLPWLPIVFHSNRKAVNIDKSAWTRGAYHELITKFHNFNK